MRVLPCLYGGAERLPGCGTALAGNGCNSMARRAAEYAKENVRATILLSLMLLFGSAGFAQRYPILPVPNSPHGIVALYQDSKSRIWVGTKDSVYCFDGVNFYSLRQFGFPAEAVSSIAEDDEGGIWIATYFSELRGHDEQGGLYRFDDRSLIKVLAADVRSVVRVGPSTMLVSSGVPGRADFGDLYRVWKTGAEWKTHRLAAKSAKFIAVASDGTAYFPCPGGACSLTNEQVRNWPADEAIAPILALSPASSPDRILRDRFGCLWERDEIEAKYSCPSHAAGQVIPDYVTGQPDSTAFLAEAPDGEVLMLGNVVLGRPESFHVARAQNGIPPNVDTALIARDGTIWLGAADGLYRFMHPFQLEFWDSQNGIDGPYAILEKGGRMFAASSGIYELDRTRRFWSLVADATRVGTVVSLADGPGNTFYAAALNRGAMLLDVDGNLLARQALEFAGASLTRDGGGRIWMAGSNIARIVRNGSRLAAQTAVGGQDASTLDIVYDREKRALWACNGREIVAEVEGQWRHIGPRQGLLNGYCQSIAATPNGDVWVAYGDFDSFSVIEDAYSDSPKVRHFDSAAGSTGNAHLSFLAVDRHGWLWRGSDAEYVATPGAARTADWMRMDRDDGISSPGGNQNAFYSADDGSVWFASANTVVHFAPPNDFATHLPVPAVFIAGVATGGGAPTLLTGNQNLPHSADITVHIGSLLFDRRSMIQLRYRLTPGSGAWQTANGFDLRLGKLSSGQHLLEVQDRMGTGRWSAGDSARITVATPPWLTWQVLSGLSFAFLGLIGCGVQWRRRLEMREAKLHRALPDLAELRLNLLTPEMHGLDDTLLDGRFEVGGMLARGGFAAVAEGRDRANGDRRCAIKIFRRELGDREWLDRRFRQEVVALEQIDHPNIVRIYGSGILPSGTMYLAMEFIEGETLRKHMETSCLPLSRVAAYLRQIGGALDAIHKRGICHRDLKPDNLMIRSAAPPGCEVVLIDFSIAIVKDPEKTMHGLSRAAGTLSYMAPEQAIGYADSATDIYSLAKVVVEMIAGERLATLLPDASLDLPQRTGEMILRLLPDFSPVSVQLLMAALEFDPARRPHDAALFAGQVASALELSRKNTSAVTGGASASRVPFPSGSAPDAG
jgi:hypothetical protein